MAVFCLVPGAWHGAWCWQLVAPLLEARGHYVLLPELVSLGEDSTSPAEVTLARWADDVASAVRALFPPRELVELTVTIAGYNCVSRVLEALEIKGTDPLPAA